MGGYRTSILVWVALLALTALTLGVSYLHLGVLNAAVALALASVKAALVGLYFMMTGLHAFHILAGMILFAGVLRLASAGKFSAAYHTPVEISGLYWHFVDVIWIYLFPLLYLIG